MRKLLLFLAVAYSLTLVALSLMNIGNLPDLEFANVDKIYHTIAYFGLVSLWQLWYFVNDTSKKFRILPLFIICMCATAFGIFIEVLQGTLTAYRTWDVLDMLANVLGVAIAALCLISVKSILEKLKSKL